MRRIFASISAIAVSVCVSAQVTVTDSLGLASAGPSVSVTDLLRGKVAGLRVSSTDGSLSGAVNTVIRGLNSIHSDSEPLWIVDGAYLSASIAQNRNAFWQDAYKNESYTKPLNQLAFLNIDDIESIEVLKDLSATALYGSRGANGVVVIRTKMPHTDGRFIDWRSELGITTGNRIAVSHDHSVRFSSRANRNAFTMSAFFKDARAGIAGDALKDGGLRLNFDSRANKTVWFGFYSSLVKGRTDAANTTTWFGTPAASGPDFDDFSDDLRTVSNIYVQINFLQNLQWHTEAGVDYDKNTRHIWYGNGTEFGKSVNGAASLLDSSMLLYKLKTQLDWSTFIADKHRIALMAGAEFSGNSDKFNTMNGSDFFTHELRSKGLSISGSKAQIRYFSRGFSSLGFFGTMSYDYAGLAGLTASLRADNAPRYEDAKYTLYPSVSAYADFRRAFFPKSNVVSGLRLKAGYGRSGRMTFAPYEMFGDFLPPCPIKAEEGTEILYEGLCKVVSGEFSVNLMLGLLDNRIALEAGWFDKRTTDNFNTYIFGQQKGDYFRWFYSSRNSISGDYAALRSRGIELSISADAVRTSSVKWTINANSTFQSTQTSAVSDDAMLGPSIGVVTNANAVGYAPGVILGYTLNQAGAYEDHTGDGSVGPEDKVVLGNTSPSVYGGLGTTLSVKGFTLDVMTDFALGHKILNLDAMLRDGVDEVSATYVGNADFWRIGRVSASYDIPVRAAWIQKLKVILSANNPAFISSSGGTVTDVDNFSASPYCHGLKIGQVPLMRSFVAGVSVTF